MARPSAHRGGNVLSRIIALAFVLYLVASSAFAAGKLQTLPAAHGLQVTVDTRWVDGQAYRPVRIKLAPTTATTTDRVIQVELLQRFNYRAEYDLAVRQDIVIPAGAKSVEATVAVPDLVAEDSLQIRFSEDGRPLPRLVFGSGGWGNRNNQSDNGLPQIVVLTDRPEQFVNQPLSQLMPSPNVGTMETMQLPNGTMINVPTSVHVRKPAEAPRRWIDYSSVDLVAIDFAALEALKSRQPEVFSALVDWTAAGGNLCIGGVAPNATALGKLHKLLGLPADDAKLSEDDGPGWRKPDKALWCKDVVTPQNPGGQPAYRYPGMPPTTPPFIESATKPASLPTMYQNPLPEVPPFLLREFGHGLLIAHQADRPLPSKQEEVAWLINSMGQTRCLWFLRHGLSRMRPNDDYWQFLIPGVGQAPVTEFCILITLFVIGIGPVNYWLLRRWKRLHLLVLTIPASAAVVTLALFAYALISDGLATRVRVRSVTRLDQRAGQAACLARLSYYAGLAPSGGLTFEGDTAVLPLEDTPSTAQHREVSPRRDLFWGEDDQQHLQSGWLASRTPAQYITARSRPTQIGIDLNRGDDGEWTAHNRLGVTVEKLAVKTRDDRLLWATDIAPGATTPLRETDQTAMRRGLDAAIGAQSMQMPANMNLGRYGGGSLFGMSRSRYRYYYGWNSGSNVVPPTQQTSRLENDLAAVRQAVLAPGSYVAIVDSSPEVDHGTTAREEDSLHVIIGQW